ncbi:MAG TPA: formyltransferase family protein, partial [Acidobacteriota bacterium]|nr:formyltransferase family protein [Acidobacteriota bacterium]
MTDETYRSPRQRGRIAVLLSGRGSNFRAILAAVREGRIDAGIVLVLSNKADAPGLASAREAGLETLFLDPKLFPSKEGYDTEIVRELDARQV